MNVSRHQNISRYIHISVKYYGTEGVQSFCESSPGFAKATVSIIFVHIINIVRQQGFRKES
jgi:hypothetical protein